MKKGKLGLKIFILIIIGLLVLIALAFIVWLIKPSTPAYVAILDKTVPATAADSHSYLDDVDNIYRKHIGLDWILDYKKVKNPATNKNYNEKTDYYGTMLDANYKVSDTINLDTIAEIPDVLYLADSYGTELVDDSGISEDDMNTIAMAHSMGSVIIGEQDIMGTGTEDKVNNQLQSLFGINQTGWVGRYIYDLADLTDVPYWAPPMYKEKYGVEWRCAGSGILLVSADGDIIVLEGKTDFETDSLLNISINKKFKDEFGKRSVNYYTWFELIEANDNTDVFANYTFNLNKTGMEKFAPISDTPVFAAAVRNTSDGAPTYYFAGDFNDYVDDMNISCFIGADLFYRTLSVDRDGDITHFFWHFFEPVVKTILDETIKDARVEHTSDANGEKVQDVETTKLSGDTLQVQIDGKWQNLAIKGFNLKAEMPGDSEIKYSRDFSSYKQLIDEIDAMGGNAVRAYDLYAPEFYRALYEHNNKKNANIIYLYQGIKTPTDIDKASITSDEAIKELYQNIEYTVDAMHGNADVPNVGKRTGAKYRHKMSKYVAAYIVDTDLSTSQLRTLVNDGNYTYQGKYLSGTDNAAESLLASLCDHVMTYQKDNYGTMVVVAAKGDTAMLTGASWQDNTTTTFNPANITVESSASEYFAVAYQAKYADTTYQNNETKLQVNGGTSYDGYLQQIKSNSSVPVIIDNYGASTCANVFEREADVYGLTEEEQATQILDMSRSIQAGGVVGGLIGDLNDSWSTVSDENYSLTVPYSSNGLWHDVTDLDQTTGVVALNSNEPTDVGMELAENNQRMQNMQTSCNETYMYITISLATAVNFDKEEFFVGFDTYQRNNGEYYYDKAFFGNALSGMEFVIKFESSNSASLYCVPSYNRNGGTMASEESYDADYDLMAVLNYGSFSSQNTQFFTTGNTVRLRIPWAMLNVSDPSQKIVVNDSAKKPSGANNQYRTTITNGMIFSVFVGEKKSQDTMYVFPSSKKSSGYKTYKWAEWKKENVTYTIAEKTAVDTLKSYFASY